MSVTIFPAPPFTPPSMQYQVSIQGQPVFVHMNRVSAMGVNQASLGGAPRPLDQTEIVSSIQFEGDEPVTMDIDVNFQIFSYKVLPQTKRSESKRDGRSLSITLFEPGCYVLEVNGTHHALHIFFDEPLRDAPDPTDPNTLYYAPGIHHVGALTLTSNQTLYIAGGAIVHGMIYVNDAENVRICGRGIMDGSLHNKGLNECILYLNKTQNMRIEGIHLRDAAGFAIAAWGCDHFRVQSVKVLGQWRYGSDGIDLMNCRDAHIADCFVRSFDDCIVLKGSPGAGDQYVGVETRDILIERCTLWNDWGRALELGAETHAPAMHHITFRDCDILHFLMIACDIQCSGQAHVHDICFEDIRIGEPLDVQAEPRLIEIFLHTMIWMKTERLGRVSDVTYANIRYQGHIIAPCRFIGFDSDSDIQQVALENIHIGDALLLPHILHPLCPLIMNDHVQGLTIQSQPPALSTVHHEDYAETCRRFLIGNGAFM